MVDTLVKHFPGPFFTRLVGTVIDIVTKEDTLLMGPDEHQIVAEGLSRFGTVSSISFNPGGCKITVRLNMVLKYLPITC